MTKMTNKIIVNQSKQRKLLKEYVKNFIEKNSTADEPKTMAIHTIQQFNTTVVNSLVAYSEERFEIPLKEFVVVILEQLVIDIEDYTTYHIEKNIGQALQRTKYDLMIDRFRKKTFIHQEELDNYVPIYKYDASLGNDQKYFIENLMMKHLTKKDLERIEFLTTEGKQLNGKTLTFDVIIDHLLTIIYNFNRPLTYNNFRIKLKEIITKTLRENLRLKIEKQNFITDATSKTMYLKPIKLFNMESESIPYEFRQGFEGKILSETFHESLLFPKFYETKNDRKQIREKMPLYDMSYKNGILELYNFPDLTPFAVLHCVVC